LSLPPLGLPLLLPLGGLGLLLGGGVPDVGGGVDCVGQFALASITDPLGHVLVVGGVDVGGTDVGGGVSVCAHVGSFGFLVQSTAGGVPVVQLPAAHVDPVDPDPPDVGIDVLLKLFITVCCGIIGPGKVVGPSPQPNLLLRQLVTYAVLYPKLQ
jgi:hypothetical protein